MKKQQKHFLIAILAGVLLYFLLPEANGLTKAGIAMLSVFLPTIYLWLTLWNKLDLSSECYRSSSSRNLCRCKCIRNLMG